MTKEEQQDINRARQLAEEIVGPVRWTTDTAGYCACHGRNLHKPKSDDPDCKIHLDGPAGHSMLFCFHGGCENELNATAERLRSALQSAGIRFEASNECMEMLTKYLKA